MILITLIVFAIIFYIGVRLYQFDNSAFTKQTGYTFRKAILDKKVTNLKKIYDVTSGPDSKLLLNVKVEGIHQTQVADAILINTSGIYVIDVHYKQGWISGTDKSYEWVEQLYKDKSKSFPNPVNDNLRLIYTLLDAHPELKKEYFETVLFFTNECSFQQVEIQASNIEVLKVNELNAWTKSMTANRLTKEQVTAFYELLMPYATN